MGNIELSEDVDVWHDERPPTGSHGLDGAKEIRLGKRAFGSSMVRLRVTDVAEDWVDQTPTSITLIRSHKRRILLRVKAFRLVLPEHRRGNRCCWLESVNAGQA